MPMAGRPAPLAHDVGILQQKILRAGRIGGKQARERDGGE